MLEQVGWRDSRGRWEGGRVMGLALDARLSECSEDRGESTQGA